MYYVKRIRKCNTYKEKEYANEVKIDNEIEHDIWIEHDIESYREQHRHLKSGATRSYRCVLKSGARDPNIVV